MFKCLGVSYNDTNGLLAWVIHKSNRKDAKTLRILGLKYLTDKHPFSQSRFACFISISFAPLRLCGYELFRLEVAVEIFTLAVSQF